MSEPSADDDMGFLLKELLRSISDKITAAPSTGSAEEVLLHLEETDKNFHNYDFVKYLRGYVESSLGTVVEDETKTLIRGDGQHAIDSHLEAFTHAVTQKARGSAEYQQMMQTLKNSMSLVVESLIKNCEEDQRQKEVLVQEKQHIQSSSQYNYNDNCSDSDSSFNQSYTFIRQEQVQALAEQLDPSWPKQVRWEALQALCSAPPSDVLSCENGSSLHKHLAAALADPDLSDAVLHFFAKSFSSSPLKMTRELYTILARSVESTFLSHNFSFAAGSAAIDVTTPEISRLLKQIRLMNDFQKEVTAFWIRHPEKYMEDVIESTFSLLSFHPKHTPPGTEKALEPAHLLALLDVRATWFKKWMHGGYSRTVVLRLLQNKYKSVIAAALQQCLHYSPSSEGSPAEAKHPASVESLRLGSAQWGLYSGQQLEYALFVHSLCLLGKVLLYKNGRRLFPIKVRKRKDPVSLTELVIILINIMYQQPRCDSPATDSLSPSGLVTEVLWMMCERKECAEECLYQTAVMEVLLAPVTAQLSRPQAAVKSSAASLTLIADVLARIASADGGLSLFLCERNVVGVRSERTFAAHVLAQFTTRLLGEELSSPSQHAVSRTLCGAFIFVCRQIYNTCEGLQVLQPYGLHRAIAAAWRKASSYSERVLTPDPGAVAPASPQEPHSLTMWEEMLLDNLLNFAATPKGVLLLQQTGAINESVSHMFSRFAKKLQVSRCEKFGYGVMMTQVAATAPGVVALHKSGFVQALIVELWSVLECSSEDVRVARPQPTPTEPIDRSCLKSFLSLVNLLSSSHSVWELLGQKSLANRTEYSLREVPSSMPDLMDRLVAVNSEAKMNSLFRYEQSHTFGLRLLNVLCCSLDSWVLLESQYGVSSMLLRSQRENVADGDGEFIIDALSVERNHLLVRVGVLGGPSERRLPPRDLQQGEHPYPWPLFGSEPPPPCYSLPPPRLHQNSQESEIAAFLASAIDSTNSETWLETCQQLYREVLTSNPSICSGNLLADLLDKVVAHLSGSAAECFFSPAHHKAEEWSIEGTLLSPVEHLGVHTCVRYGRYLGLLRDDAAPDLTLLLRRVKAFLSSQRIEPSPELRPQQEGYPGHDWLASSVFMVTRGEAERSLRLLLRLSCLLPSAFIWPARIHASIHLPGAVAGSGAPPLYWCTAHYVEMLLKAEVPLVHSAFRVSGFTPSQMCLHWLAQCFWNYLDWTEVCHYLCCCVLMGADYQVYTCVAAFKHLQPQILQHTQRQELQLFLKEDPIRGFRVCDYLQFMMELERSYRSVVLTAMRSICSTAE
ncbi:protein broad-minded-like isoform X2 [Takifugu rubripes]|uniref:Protein broad-minded n=1 Tax=Takifugu rubripes TaxID=31033 RepID=A0A674MC98_TAKRU|nr:protein broad-minded-like isoform X2 [Takifugu rubripes]